MSDQPIDLRESHSLELTITPGPEASGNLEFALRYGPVRRRVVHWVFSVGVQAAVIAVALVWMRPAAGMKGVIVSSVVVVAALAILLINTAPWARTCWLWWLSRDSRSAYRVPTQFQLIVDRVGVTRADADGSVSAPWDSVIVTRCRTGTVIRLAGVYCWVPVSAFPNRAEYDAWRVVTQRLGEARPVAARSSTPESLGVIVSPLPISSSPRLVRSGAFVVLVHPAFFGAALVATIPTATTLIAAVAALAALGAVAAWFVRADQREEPGGPLPGAITRHSDGTVGLATGAWDRRFPPEQATISERRGALELQLRSGYRFSLVALRDATAADISLALRPAVKLEPAAIFEPSVGI